MLLALSLAALPLTACKAPPAPDNGSTSTSSTQVADCNEQACLLTELHVLSCTPDKQRKLDLAVINTSKSLARYRIDYYPPDVALERGDNLKQIDIGNGQIHKHILVSGVFGKAVTITITQLTRDGNTIVKEMPVKATLKPC